PENRLIGEKGGAQGPPAASVFQNRRVFASVVKDYRRLLPAYTFCLGFPIRARLHVSSRRSPKYGRSFFRCASRAASEVLYPICFSHCAELPGPLSSAPVPVCPNAGSQSGRQSRCEYPHPGE